MIQCPKCHSTNVVQTDANRYECPYCGNVFNPSASNYGSRNAGANGYTVPKKRVTAGILAIFLGGIGIHYFYLNKPVAGILFLLCCWLIIPGIIAFVQGIVILSMTDEDFQTKYVNTSSSFPLF